MGTQSHRLFSVVVGLGKPDSGLFVEPDVCIHRARQTQLLSLTISPTSRTIRIERESKQIDVEN